jgi:tRNA 2-thiouridine synthesizing protein A
MGLFSSGKNKSDTNDANVTVTLSDGQTVSVSTSVDCLGDSCPRPQLMTKKAVSKAGSGDVVSVLVDNPTSMEALPPMCDGMDAVHLETLPDQRGWQVIIRKN